MKTLPCVAAVVFAAAVVGGAGAARTGAASLSTLSVTAANVAMERRMER